MYKIELESHIRDKSVWFALEDLKKEVVEKLLIDHPVSGICEEVDYVDGALHGRVLFENDWRNFIIRVINEK